MNVLANAPEPGRVCPVDYVYSPAALARAQDFDATTLYAVGGLYGNLAALDAVEKLAAAEPSPPVIVFNGDFHWFDAEPNWFAEIGRRIHIGADIGSAGAARQDYRRSDGQESLIVGKSDQCTKSRPSRIIQTMEHRLVKFSSVE